jgi:hypothetical protein
VKKYTNSQITGGHGVALVAERVFAMGHVYQETGDLEAGIDGYIEIRDPETDEATGLTLGVQSKATAGRFTGETEETFEYHVEERDLQYWLSGNLPILLVVSRPQSDEAYYKSIDEYFSSQERRKERKVVFNKEADRFDESASEDLISLARPQDSGLHISPAPQEEELLSNLLPVRHYPSTVFHAETEYRRPGAIWAEAKENSIDIPGEWILHNKRIWSIVDPRETSLSKFCEPPTTESANFSDWASSRDRDRKVNFIRMLGQCLRQRLRLIRVGYNSKKKMYYFWSSHDLSKRKARYQHHGGSKPHQTVFEGYPEHSQNPDEVNFYRHRAFQGYFERIEGRWYLEITPTYYFTEDGHKPHPGGGKLASNVKRYEKHASVRNQVEFWGYQLRRGGFDSTYPHLRFAPLKTFTIDHGIDDQQWRDSGSAEEEPTPDEPETKQKGLFDE